MKDIDQSQAIKLGTLIHDARIRNRSSISDCSKVLGIDEQAFEEMENGQHLPSLPEVEVLAMYLDVPMGYFWGGEQLKSKPQRDYLKYMALRHVIIGTTVRQYRDNKGITLDELAEELEIDREELLKCETGQPISLLDLTSIIHALDRTMMDLYDDNYGPLAHHQSNITQRKKFDDLPEDIKDFVVEPVNRRYLEVAIHLSSLDADGLRAIGESLLEITY